MKIRQLHWVSLCLVAFLSPVWPTACEAFQSVEGDVAPPKVVDLDNPETTPMRASRDQTSFLRVHSDEFKNPVALQSATTKYALKNDEGEVEFEVYLESVIHIADASYYRGFQQRFEQYDSVLYELVTDHQEDKSDEEDLPSGFQLFQQISTGTLGLSYQLDEIEYDAKNMLHSDLSQNEMAARMADRGETGTTLFVDLLAHIIKKVSADQQTSGTEPNDALASDQPAGDKLDVSLLTDANGIMKIRRLMATTLVNSQLLDSSFPPSIHRLVIDDRNDRVMSVLNREKKKGNSGSQFSSEQATWQTLNND